MIDQVRVLHKLVLTVFWQFFGEGYEEIKSFDTDASAQVRRDEGNGSGGGDLRGMTEVVDRPHRHFLEYKFLL